MRILPPKYTRYANWSLAAFVAASLCFALPAIAGKAAVNKDAAIWQVKAEAFAAHQNEKRSSADFKTDPATPSHMAVLFDPEDNMPSARRDALVISPLSSIHVNSLRYAHAEMAEYQCLSDAIYYEARSETLSGQLGVAEVVHNRVKSKHYPNTICGVVYQGSGRKTGCQFSFTCDGSLGKGHEEKAWEQSRHAARLSLMGLHAPLTERATHYHTVEVSPKWAKNMRFEKQIGFHKFHSFKWRERPVETGPALSVAPPI